MLLRRHHATGLGVAKKNVTVQVPTGNAGIPAGSGSSRKGRVNGGGGLVRQAGVPPSSPLEGVGETQRAPSTAQGLVEGGTGGGAERLP